MRITFVLPPLNPSGGIRVLATYADRLQRRGHQVVVVATSDEQPSAVRRVVRVLRGKQPPPWRKTPVRITYFESSAVDLREVPHAGPVTDADVPDADVVIATWWNTAPMVYRLSPSKGRKVYFLQGYESSLSFVPTEAADATWRLPMRKIVVAQWLADLAREKFGDPSATCVPNSVDSALFFANQREKQAVPTVGLIYAPATTKGTDIAIMALTKAKEQVPSLRVMCFGHSAPVPPLPIPAWFDFTLSPPQATIRNLYAACDAFLQPSRIEGFGLPILEAMACRTPVIATPAGAAPELLRSGGGKLVAAESPDEMAAAIVEVARASEAEWHRWSDAAFLTATGYSWDDATIAFEAALEQARAAPVT